MLSLTSFKLNPGQTPAVEGSFDIVADQARGGFGIAVEAGLHDGAMLGRQIASGFGLAQ